jgi:peptidoglycan L-alanyl-D-glutamate endopeptidase CwlK
MSTLLGIKTMASRDIKDLYPPLQTLCAAFLRQCRAAGLDILITCTWRSGTEQAALYAQGRTKPGAIVTRAKAGQSKHNFMIAGEPAAKAFDFVPLVNGKPVWDASHPHWAKAGKIGMALGLNWYGAPGAPFKEYPHMQYVEAQ